jgi:hypothetical protein
MSTDEKMSGSGSLIFTHFCRWVIVISGGQCSSYIWGTPFVFEGEAIAKLWEETGALPCLGLLFGFVVWVR